MSIPADPRPPADVRRKMLEIFQRPEFQRRSSPLRRALDWVLQKLSGLLPKGGASGAWGGPIGTVVLWVALLLLTVGLIWLIAVVVMRRRPRARRSSEQVQVEIEEHRTPEQWNSSAAAAERAGDWKEAIRCRYRELVERLVDAGQVSPTPGRTTGELRGDVAGGLPAALGDFSAASELFELPWYADEPTGPAEYARFRELAGRVLDAVPATATKSGAGISRRRAGDRQDRELVDVS